MKMIKERLGVILHDQSGETIVEAIVAFALLSIMLVIFAQGLAWATTTEVKASENRKNADETMIELQDKLASEPVNKSDGVKIDNNIPIRRYVKDVDGQKYIVYEAD